MFACGFRHAMTFQASQREVCAGYGSLGQLISEVPCQGVFLLDQAEHREFGAVEHSIGCIGNLHRLASRAHALDRESRPINH